MLKRMEVPAAFRKWFLKESEFFDDFFELTGTMKSNLVLNFFRIHGGW